MTVLLLVLGIIGVGGRAEFEGTDRVFLLDVSRSHTMPSTGAFSCVARRLEEVRDERGDRASVVAFGAGAKVVVAPCSAWVAAVEVSAICSSSASLPTGIGEGSDLAAGIEAALGIADPAYRLEITVFGDGRYPRDAVDAAVARVARRGGSLTFAGPLPLLLRPEDLRLEPEGPAPRLEAGREAGVALRVSAEGSRERSVTVEVGAQQFEFRLRPGESRVIRTRLPVPVGEEAIIATLRADPPDHYRANDRVLLPVVQPGRRRIAVLGARAPEVADLLRAAEALWDVVMRDGRAPGMRLEVLDAVVLADVPCGPGFTAGDIEALASAVTEGGLGLVAFGGPRSFRAGAWAATALEPLLPLNSRPPRRRDVVVLLDCSGSMERDRRLQRAVEATLRLCEGLAPGDRIQVLPFAAQLGEPLPSELCESADFSSRAASGLDQIVPRGGTRLVPALECGLDLLRDQRRPGATPVLVVLSDFRDPALDAPAVARRWPARLAEVEGEAIAVLLDPEAETRGRAAALGGRVVPAPALTPRLLLDALEAEGWSSEPVDLRWTGEPWAAATTLGARNAVTPGERAEIILETAVGDPLLARARRGAGEVLAFATDPILEAWTAGLVATLVRRALPSDPARGPRVSWEGEHLTLAGVDHDDPAPLELVRAGGGRPLVERSAGVWETRDPLPALPAGAAIVRESGGRVLWRVAIPPRRDPEYRVPPHEAPVHVAPGVRSAGGSGPRLRWPLVLGALGGMVLLLLMPAPRVD